ncbi:hypothetical protein ACJQWK_08337 [Exserohilum turcicum]
MGHVATTTWLSCPSDAGAQTPIYLQIGRITVAVAATSGEFLLLTQPLDKKRHSVLARHVMGLRWAIACNDLFETSFVSVLVVCVAAAKRFFGVRMTSAGERALGATSGQ